MLRDHLCAPYDQQGRDISYLILHRHLLVALYVYLSDLQAVFVLGCHLIQDWRDRFAGAAPSGPEVQEHGHRALKNLGGKVSGVDFLYEWAGHGGPRVSLNGTMKEEPIAYDGDGVTTSARYLFGADTH